MFKWMFYWIGIIVSYPIYLLAMALLLVLNTLKFNGGGIIRVIKSLLPMRWVRMWFLNIDSVFLLDSVKRLGYDVSSISKLADSYYLSPFSFKEHNKLFGSRYSVAYVALIIKQNIQLTDALNNSIVNTKSSFWLSFREAMSVTYGAKIDLNEIQKVIDSGLVGEWYMA